MTNQQRFPLNNNNSEKKLLGPGSYLQIEKGNENLELK